MASPSAFFVPRPQPPYPTLRRIGYNKHRSTYNTIAQANEDAMSTKTTDRVACMRALRDAKARPHLRQYAPVWLANEEVLSEQDAIRFEVVFYHPYYGWVRRRYLFDAFNNVLYHKGQVPFSEAEALALETQEPYIPAEVVNTVDAYGG